MLVSDILTPAWCGRLIRYWESDAAKLTNHVASAEAKSNVCDVAAKQRHDAPVNDPELARALVQILDRRVMSELARYFGCVVREGETLRIGCYEAAEEGRFHMHRDTNMAVTMRRRFALSLNLNDDYEGGFLRFPEFPGLIYRPAAGSGVVFSCSPLHEAMPVT